MTQETARLSASGDTPMQTAKEETRAVAGTAVDAGGDVVSTAKEQTREVAAEAGRQARDLYEQARVEVTDQARSQQQRAARGLYSLADEAARMVDKTDESGPVSEVVRAASERMRHAGRWLEDREPGDLVSELKGYARSHPGTFLVGAAVLGVLAGRLTRNLGASPNGSSSPDVPTVEVPATYPAAIPPMQPTPTSPLVDGRP